MSQQERKEMADRKEEIFRQLISVSLKPLPGLIELISFLKKHEIKIGAVTNAPKENVNILLKVLKIENEFDTLVLGNECLHPKPSPEPYLKGLCNLGVTSDSCIVFEDSITGLTASVAAGILSVGVLTSQTPQILQNIGATYTLPDFTFIDFDKIFEMKDFVKI